MTLTDNSHKRVINAQDESGHVYNVSLMCRHLHQNTELCPFHWHKQSKLIKWLVWQWVVGYFTKLVCRATGHLHKTNACPGLISTAVRGILTSPLHYLTHPVPITQLKTGKAEFMIDSLSTTVPTLTRAASVFTPHNRLSDLRQPY